jgi:predicted kinase
MSTNIPVQYIMVGLPFSGKTNLAKTMEKKLGFARVSIDDIKFEKGYKGVSDDGVPDEVWKDIFNESDRRVIEYLKQGKSVLNETAWTTKEWRERARKLAETKGFSTKIIYVKIKVEEARERLIKNRKTGKRFDVSDKIFNEAVEEFEEPTKDENVIIYEGKKPIEEWIQRNFN